MNLLTAAPSDDNTPGRKPEVSSTPTAGDGRSLDHQAHSVSVSPMQAERARDRGMDRVLYATSPTDRAAIAAALLRGFDTEKPMTAEDALVRAVFVWPASARPRSLGAIVSHLSRAGLIIETAWTKGRLGRPHAGRVSLWLKVTA